MTYPTTCSNSSVFRTCLVDLLFNQDLEGWPQLGVAGSDAPLKVGPFSCKPITSLDKWIETMRWSVSKDCNVYWDVVLRCLFSKKKKGSILSIEKARNFSGCGIMRPFLRLKPCWTPPKSIWAMKKTSCLGYNGILLHCYMGVIKTHCKDPSY